MRVETNKFVRVGVQAIVIKDNEVLLGKRKNAFQEGSWGLPGGHLELDETILQAAARELLEETGILAKQMHVFCVTDPKAESNYHMQVGVIVDGYEGIPSIMEPDKCSELRFCMRESLPTPLFVSSVQVLKNYINATFYAGNTL